MEDYSFCRKKEISLTDKGRRMMFDAIKINVKSPKLRFPYLTQIIPVEKTFQLHQKLISLMWLSMTSVIEPFLKASMVIPIILNFH